MDRQIGKEKDTERRKGNQRVRLKERDRQTKNLTCFQI